MIRLRSLQQFKPPIPQAQCFDDFPAYKKELVKPYSASARFRNWNSDVLNPKHSYPECVGCRLGCRFRCRHSCPSPLTIKPLRCRLGCRVGCHCWCAKWCAVLCIQLEKTFWSCGSVSKAMAAVLCSSPTDFEPVPGLTWLTNLSKILVIFINGFNSLAMAKHNNHQQ